MNNIGKGGTVFAAVVGILTVVYLTTAIQLNTLEIKEIKKKNT